MQSKESHSSAISRCKSSLALHDDLCHLCIQPTKLRPGQKTYQNDFEPELQSCLMNKGPKVASWNLLGTPFQALPTCLSICSVSRLLRTRLPSSTLFGAHLEPGNVSASKQLCAVQAVYNQEVFPRTPWQCF